MRAWQSAGGGPAEIREIDYAEVLQERAGAADSSWDLLIDSCLMGDSRSALDEKALASLLEIARDPERLGEFMNRLQERARATGQSIEVQKQAVAAAAEEPRRLRAPARARRLRRDHDQRRHLDDPAECPR